MTGGNRGIGRSIVKKLSAEGAVVIYTYLEDKRSADNLQCELEDNKNKVFCFQMDATSRQSVKSACDRISMVVNKIDVLVNNAGINKPEDFDKITDKEWDAVLSVNLKGPFIVTQEALPLLKKSTSASVINIGSVSGQYGGPRTAHYAASKAGLISLGQVIARYGAEFNIRCNTVAAGLIVSEMAKKGLKSAAVAQASEGILMKRMGKKCEVADVVVFLASSESSYITAQTINVNGGLYF